MAAAVHVAWTESEQKSSPARRNTWMLRVPEADLAPSKLPATRTVPARLPTPTTVKAENVRPPGGKAAPSKVTVPWAPPHPPTQKATTMVVMEPP